MIETIINSEAFLIVISGVLIFVFQKLSSELWISPTIEFKKCLGKLEALLIRYEFLSGYEYGTNNGANNHDVDYFRQELRSLTSELISTFVALPSLEKLWLRIRRIDVNNTKPQLLLLSQVISTKEDIIKEKPKAKEAIKKIRNLLKFKPFKIDYSKI